MEVMASMGSFVSRVARALATTSAAELVFTARAFVLAPLVEGALAWRGIDGTLEVIDRIGVGTRRPGAREGAEAERAVARAFRLQPWLPGRCLPRALVRFALPRRDGVPARLVVGVRRAETRALDAHAWVEPPAPDAVAGYVPILTREAP
jgi:hypothetical protein